LTGPQHALDRVPVSLRAHVLRWMLSKIEKANAPKRPRRKKRVTPAPKEVAKTA
jgi:hypothetical protein